MAGLGLLGTLNTATRGLAVQQGAINTTSHNIANANTTGYSRQRAIIQTTRPFGGMSMFDTCSYGQTGTGAEITTIQRVRDSFIDYQVRSETGASGYYSSRSETLSKIENVFAEPSDNGIQELISKFYSAFQEVSKNPNSQDVKTAALKQASALADQINYAYTQLEKATTDSQKVLQTNVTDINSYLDQVNELNKQIKSVAAVGQTPNDLMDKRDNLIDQLSSKFGIKLDRDKFETINLASTEYPNSALVRSDPNDVGYSRLSYVKSATPIMDPSDNTKFTGKITVEYYPLGNEKAPVQTLTIDAGGTDDATKKKNATDAINDLMQNRVLIGNKDGIVGTDTTTTSTTVPTDVAGTTIASDGTITTITISGGTTTRTVTNNTEATTFSAKTTGATTVSGLDSRIFKTYEYESGLNSVDNNNIKGEIAANQSVQNDLKSMMEGLDRLAESIAYTVNAVENGSTTAGTTTQGLTETLIFVNNSATTVTDTGITAKNIKVNSAVIKDPTKLNCKTASDSGVGDGKRAAAIANLGTLTMKTSNVLPGTDLTNMTRAQFLSAVGVTGFSDATTDNLNLQGETEGSTIVSYYKTLINNLGVETQEASRKADNQDIILAKLEDDKSQVSGVSLDEETTNLIQFQHAYQANAK